MAFTTVASPMESLDRLLVNSRNMDVSVGGRTVVTHGIWCYLEELVRIFMACSTRTPQKSVEPITLGLHKAPPGPFIAFQKGPQRKRIQRGFLLA